MKTFILIKANTGDAVVQRVRALTTINEYMHRLPEEKSYTVEIKERKGTRSQQQNAFLWATYQRILDAGGEELRGWTKDDLHEFFLGSHFGWETLEGFGKKRLRPLNRSSKLSKMEFVDFVAFIQQFMSERGVYLPDPGEQDETTLAPDV